MAEDPSEVRQAIEQDRLDLADTVQALARKADVKQRVRESVAMGADQLQHTAGHAASKVRGVTPAQLQAGLGSATQSVRKRPLPVVVGMVFCFGVLVGHRKGRRGAQRCL